MNHQRSILALCLCVLFTTPAVGNDTDRYDPALYAGLHWRMIGPFRGGRTVAATGVLGHPNLFYIAASNGGVWRSDDYGRTWDPIFDDQPTGSIGAIAVAPSNPGILYVGSGEGLQRPDLSTGDGIYKSTDGGKTWVHLGLREGQQIGALLVDPRDPNRVFAAVLGHPYGANAERGVFRSTDGGRHWQKVLYKDENTGAIALAFDPTNSQIIYADLFASRQGPWENGVWTGTSSGLYKSTNGGNTWRQLTGGLPTAADKLGRIGFAIAPSDSRRLYATVDVPEKGGIYRSDDAGQTWHRINSEQRLWTRGYDFAEVKVDPRNPDIVYVANTSTYRSTDGGHTFTAIRGAPGGDDYHTLCINPENPDIILLAGDQGAVVTVNRGRTWSSWYNQPTAQFYHVVTDNRFPYWVYGAQQESGSAAVCSRGPTGRITFRDWHPIGVEEYGYVAPDPLNSDLIYGGKATRFNEQTGQVKNVSPDPLRSHHYRFLRTAPILFSPVDPHTLYLAGNVLFKTTDGGDHWDVISPDLTREHPDVPASIGIFRTPDLAQMQRRGVIYTVAPSYQDRNIIWAGTDDGLIHVTRDGGKSWQAVTPSGVTAWSKIALIDSGRFDAATAYAAVNRMRLDDQRPHIYRTHDFGNTWQEIVRGLPSGPVNVVREDPERRGLLFCGTEQAVFVSFNDGDNWQPLRLNMPATSIRDLVIHGDDLVVGTHGRSFWILDDITPLRQLSPEIASADVFLFRPQPAWRVRNNVNTDTPLPPDEPGGQNPPDGAIVDYKLQSDAHEPVVLEFLDQAGRVVRRYTSADAPEPVNEKELDIPLYWIRPPQPLSARAGMHRFVWDLHYPSPEGPPRVYPMTAVIRDTPSEPRGPWVLPGEYTVRLTVGASSRTQPLPVRRDPRVPTPSAELARQFELSLRAWEGIQQVHEAIDKVNALRARLKVASGKGKATPPLEKELAALEGETLPRYWFFMGGPQKAREQKSLHQVLGELSHVLALLQGSDTAPTSQMIAAANQVQGALTEVLNRWHRLQERERAACATEPSPGDKPARGSP